MGHEVYVHAELGTQSIVAVVPADVFEKAPRKGDMIRLCPDNEWIHLFDQESGANVSLGKL
jgi:oligogalacturonide transport system ATP-binding protein